MFLGHNRTRFQRTFAILIITNLQEATVVGMVIEASAELNSAIAPLICFQPTPSRDGYWSSKRLNPNLTWLPETNFLNLGNIALETVVTGGLTIPEKAQT